MPLIASDAYHSKTGKIDQGKIFLNCSVNEFSQKEGFLGIDNKIQLLTKSIVIPFGLEKTVSYGSGTKHGPKEIIKASHQVELYDEELNCEPYKKIGIKTIKPFKIKKV